MNSVAREEVGSENSMKFHDAESGGFPTGACQIVNPSAPGASLVGRASCPSLPNGQAGSLPRRLRNVCRAPFPRIIRGGACCVGALNEGQPPIINFCHDNQRVLCSYIRDAGHRIDPSDRQRTKSSLIRNLLKFVGTSQGPAAPTATSEIQIKSGPLGKPELRVDGHERFCVSFSHTAAETWGALCWTGGIVGIDVARREEFPHNYPFHRAFNDEEFSKALEITQGNIPEAAALLWTAKEAVVKCVGTGFHLVDPLELLIVAGECSSNEYLCAVCCDNKVFERLPGLRESFIEVLTLMKDGLGVSVAIMIKNSDADSYGARSRGPRSSEFVAMRAAGRR